MKVSDQIRQICAEETPFEVQFAPETNKEELKTSHIAKTTKLYSEEYAKRVETFEKALKIKPKTVVFETLMPVTKPNDVQKRKQLHESAKVDYLKENKKQVKVLNETKNADRIEAIQEYKQQERKIYEEVEQILEQPKVHTLELQQQDIYCGKVEISELLQFFKTPYSFESDFNTYLSKFKIFEEMKEIKKIAIQTRHTSLIFRDASKAGLQRANQLKKADMFNNQVITSLEMLVKWCSGYSYLPLKSFEKTYDEQKQAVKDILKIKYLKKEDIAKVPLYKIIPAGESVDHLTFDRLEMEKIVKKAKEELDENVWEPYVLYKDAFVVFEKMYATNPKTRGVELEYKRCEYEKLLYQRFESNFVEILKILATQQADENEKCKIEMNLSEILSVVDKLKVGCYISQQLKEKVAKRERCNNMYSFAIDGYEINYSGYVRKLRDGETIEEPDDDLDQNEAENAEEAAQETTQENKQPTEEEQRQLDKAAAEEEEKQRQILLEMERKQEEVDKMLRGEADDDLKEEVVEQDEQKAESAENNDEEKLEQAKDEPHINQQEEEENEEAPQDEDKRESFEEEEKPLEEEQPAEKQEAPIEEPSEDLPQEENEEDWGGEGFKKIVETEEEPALQLKEVIDNQSEEEQEDALPAQENEQEAADEGEQDEVKEELPDTSEVESGTEEPVKEEQNEAGNELAAPEEADAPTKADAEAEDLPNLPEELPPTAHLQSVVHDESEAENFFKPDNEVATNEEHSTSSTSSSRRRRKHQQENLADASINSDASESTESRHRRKRRQEGEETSDISKSSDRRKHRREQLPQMQDEITVEHFVNQDSAQDEQLLPAPTDLPEDLPMDAPPEFDENEAAQPSLNQFGENEEQEDNQDVSKAPAADELFKRDDDVPEEGDLPKINDFQSNDALTGTSAKSELLSLDSKDLE